ncbi:MAG: hypothetical protein A2V88_08700 [Elusimicrobia bacterium RBG_16_66_12]|nr:MAG: hypothetical protein A2V88_08700 [Elusimicrobia bacterium RBG_16_66_12]
MRLAVEWDPKASACYGLNFPGATLFEGDIAALTGDEALKMACLGPGQLDVLDGSPPCQGFSTAGKRRMTDTRNRLFEEYVRLLRDFRPRAFIMENVSGLVKGKMKLTFAEMTRALKAAGYRVSCRLLNAWWYGVPQDRQRLVWIGLRDDLDIAPSHLTLTHQRPVTVREAFLNIGASDAPELSPRYRRYWYQAQQGETVGRLTSVKKLSENKVAGTLVGSEGNGAPYHPTECRAISTAERKRLSGFPDQFTFPSRETATVLIGNSVPPPMAEAVGRHVAGLLKGAAPGLEPNSAPNPAPATASHRPH